MGVIDNSQIGLKIATVIWSRAAGLESLAKCAEFVRHTIRYRVSLSAIFISELGRSDVRLFRRRWLICHEKRAFCGERWWIIALGIGKLRKTVMNGDFWNVKGSGHTFACLIWYYWGVDKDYLEIVETTSHYSCRIWILVFLNMLGRLVIIIAIKMNAYCLWYVLTKSSICTS